MKIFTAVNRHGVITRIVVTSHRTYAFGHNGEVQVSPRRWPAFRATIEADGVTVTAGEPGPSDVLPA